MNMFILTVCEVKQVKQVKPCSISFVIFLLFRVLVVQQHFFKFLNEPQKPVFIFSVGIRISGLPVKVKKKKPNAI